MAIEVIPYAVGFLVYIGFCMITFEVYSKKQEVTNMTVLYMIYLYYTILAGYLINLVDSSSSYGIRFFQVLIYAVAAGIILTHRYRYIAEQNEEKARAHNVSF